MFVLCVNLCSQTANTVHLPNVRNAKNILCSMLHRSCVRSVPTISQTVWNVTMLDYARSAKSGSSLPMTDFRVAIVRVRSQIVRNVRVEQTALSVLWVSISVLPPNAANAMTDVWSALILPRATYANQDFSKLAVYAQCAINRLSDAECVRLSADVRNVIPNIIWFLPPTVPCVAAPSKDARFATPAQCAFRVTSATSLTLPTNARNVLPLSDAPTAIPSLKLAHNV